MRIAIPVSQFHQGNTSEYVQRAFSSLGHESKIITPEEFYQAFPSDHFDFYFCVDSGEPFQFSGVDLSTPLSKRLSFWFIDYRHNKHRDTRKPPDFFNAQLLNQSGAWIFQAQKEDFEDCISQGIANCSWLPMAADLEIWNSIPESTRDFDIGFVGNVWDAARLKALQEIQKAGFKLAFRGHGAAWKEDGAKLLRRSKIGFNISSFYGAPEAYDINMRFFETLSCGVPLVTNKVPSLSNILPGDKTFVKTYASFEDIIPTLRRALEDSKFLSSGEEARQWVKENATYEIRMKDVLSKIESLTSGS